MDTHLHKNTRDATNAKLVISGILVLLYGLLLLALAAILFAFWGTGGFFGEDSTGTTHTDYAIPIIVLGAGLNFTVQGLWLLRSRNRLVKRFGLWLALLIVQTPVLVIAPAKLGIDYALSDTVPTWIFVRGLYVSIGISIAATLALWTLAIVGAMSTTEPTPAEL